MEAFDRDADDNGRVEYSLLETANTRGRFRIHPTNGVVYAQQSLLAGQEYSFAVRKKNKHQHSFVSCQRQKRNAQAPVNYGQPFRAMSNSFIFIAVLNGAHFVRRVSFTRFSFVRVSLFAYRRTTLGRLGSATT